MINKTNIEIIKKLADKIEYKVTKTEKEARISPIYEQFAFDSYKEDLLFMLSEVKKNVIATYNHNTKDYYNIFIGKKNTQVNNTIDMLRCKLTKKEANKVIEQHIDLECKDNLYIEYEDDTTEKQKATIKKKILDNIIIETVEARGYSQGDYEKYTIVYYKDIKKEAQATIDNILKNLKYIFTVQEYYIELIDIETRLYTSGIEEIEEVEGNSYSAISYDGYLNEEEKQLTKDGYTVIYKN